ncbi:chaperonin cofactor prefoldin [Thermocatellispora tengchongensis]|uniref:Chaperonin cofactor prefoldin n=1 Tax=Thermocatellispora tengchongensis TaxID=1073253 RepID=A0A840PF12_9ACTN|nr:hypothetical protein [Thermocatellispora tengchongensis]MBB5140014.1 chaperonin cofactor prefoldin [Thermocatellispora tengchongensis]
MRDEARRLREIEEAEHRAALAERAGELAEQEQTRITAEAEAEAERTRAKWRRRRAVWAERTRTAGRLAVMSVTNVGVNLVAVSGQAMAFMQRGLPPLWAVLAAGIVESVAVYVSWHAHVALREGDAAWVTRMTSYGIGAGAGYLSYTHVEDYPELFAACSLASPWLWSMHSRHLHRQDLRAGGLIDPRAPKFSALRWLLHTRETFAAFKWAVSEGVQSPHIAVEVVRSRRTVQMTWRSVEDTQAVVVATQRVQLELALTQLAAVSEELHGLDPDAAAAKETIARFVNRVGAGMFPMYRPLSAGELRPAAEQTDEKRTDGADDDRTDGGPRVGGWLRQFLPGHGRTADENGSAGRTGKADEKRTDGGRKADDEPAKKRTDGADGKRTNGGRSAKKRTGGRRPSGRTNGRAAGPDDLGELLPLGRTILAEHQQNGVRLTRDRLAAAVKAGGRTISNERASALLRVLQTNGSSAANGADGNGSSAQTKTAADGGPSGAENADESGSSADDNDDKGAN